MRKQRWFDVYITMLNGLNAVTEPSNWRFLAAAFAVIMCGILSVNIQLARHHLGHDDI